MKSILFFYVKRDSKTKIILQSFVDNKNISKKKFDKKILLLDTT